jgi:hypothetical protein
METLRMSRNERRRLAVMSQVQSGKLSLGKASEVLGISYRQVKRVWGRYRSEGDRGLVHGLRGRASNHRGSAKLRKRILARYVKEYGDYGPTLATECLAEEGRVSGGRGRIAGVGRGRSSSASWCRWTARITTGSKVAGRRRC